MQTIKKYVSEYIIVDHGSTDNTVELCEQFFVDNNIKNVILDVKYPSSKQKQQLLEIGCQYSDCEYLWLYDADNKIIRNLQLPEKLNALSYQVKYVCDPKRKQI